MEISNLPVVVKKINLDVEEKYKKQIVKDLVTAIIFVAYLLCICIFSMKMNNTFLVNFTKVIATCIFGYSIYGFEKAYKHKDMFMGLTDVEYTAYSFILLKATYDLAYFHNKFYIFILFASGFVSAYYFIKVFVYYTIAAKNKLSVVSDAKEITKDEPVKQKAVRHNLKAEEPTFKDQTKARIKEALDNDKTIIAQDKINKYKAVNVTKSMSEKDIANRQNVNVLDQKLGGNKKNTKQTNAKQTNTNKQQTASKKENAKPKTNTNTKTNANTKTNETKKSNVVRYYKIDLRKKSVLDQKMKPKDN